MRSRHPHPALLKAFAVAAVLLLAGCDIPGLGPTPQMLARESEAKAVGSACRQSGRAIEDCYAIYSWLPKASTYEGWRDMDAYMRENKLETVEPQLPPVPPPNAKKRPAANAAPAAKNSAEK